MPPKSSTAFPCAVATGLLKVTVAEVQRESLNTRNRSQGQPWLRHRSVNSTTTIHSQPWSALERVINHAKVRRLVTDPLLGVVPRFQATIRAMERAGVIRTLAELFTASPVRRRHLSWRRIPIPSGLTCDASTHRRAANRRSILRNSVSVSVHTRCALEGRISMRVMTEVSELSTDNAISLGGVGGQKLTVPRSGLVAPRRWLRFRQAARWHSPDDPGIDQATDQWPARPDAAPGARTLFKSRD